MISLLRYLTSQGCTNPDVTAPLVRDILEKFKAEIEFDGISDSDINIQLAVIRAFHYVDPLWGKGLFHKCIAAYPDGIPQSVLLEILSVLETLLPLLPEDTELLLKHLTTSCIKDTGTLSLYRSILFQDAASDSIMPGSCPPSGMDAESILAKLPPAVEPALSASVPDASPLVPTTVTICQIADIHFGKFHSFKAEEYGPSGIFTGATQDLSAFLRFRIKTFPDFYVVCGDLASDKADDFQFFRKFVESLPISSGSIYDRLLVVPGNHDIFWTPDGNDKLEAFRTNIGSIYLTPFGRDLSTPECYHGDFDGCPVAIYVYHDERAIFLLLTSSLYSGDYEKKILEFLNRLGKEPKDLDSLIQERIRFENGYLHTGYINKTEEIISNCQDTLGSDVFKSYFKLAVIHHNFDAVHDTDTTIAGGPGLRLLLKNMGFAAVVHGHTHKSKHFPEAQHAVQTFSVKTFSGKHSPEKNGLNIIRYDRLTSSISEVLNYDVFEGQFNPTPTKIV